MNEFDVLESPLSGTNLIEASAGTGKTYAISIIYLRLIVENNFRIEDILVVTFTIPATMELRQRVRDRLRDAMNVVEGREIDDKTVTMLMEKYIENKAMKQRISAAIKSFDQASVYTIHSFCQQMLVDNAFESGSLFSSEIVNDDRVIGQGITDLCRRTLYNSSPALVSYFMENCSTAELLDLYKKRPLAPDLRIEPEARGAGNESLEEISERITELYNQLRLAWKKEKINVTEILNREKLLNGKSYGNDSNDGIIEQMDTYLSDDEPFDLFSKFVNFTSDKIRKSLNKGSLYPESPVFEISQKLFDACAGYNRAGASMLVEIKKNVFEVIDRLVLDKKSIISSRSFDDLIRDAYTGLNGPSGRILGDKVRGRYRAALIDEFQDTDNLQFDIFNRLFNNEKTILFLIGDPKQAIYRFRGADIFSYIRASQLMQNRYTLTRNWRSRGELIESVNALFGRCKNPFVFERIKFYPVKPGEENQSDLLLNNGKPMPVFDIWLASEEAAHAGNRLIDKLAAEISLLINRDDGNPYRLGDRKVNPGDIAVLVRTGKQGIEVRNAFVRYNIPSVSRGMDSVFKTGEAVDLYFIISAVADPSNYNFVRGAVSTVAMGGDAAVLYSLNRDKADGENKFNAVTSRFYDYREIWISGGFFSMITALLDGESFHARLLSLNGGERMITNINHLSEILHKIEYENDFTPRELSAWLGNAVLSPPDGDDYSMRIERDDDAVNIITMHACKGLEFPVVYCPFLAHSGRGNDKYLIYHDTSDNDRPVIYLDSDIPGEIAKIKAAEDLAENVRLFYVALTRGKSACRVLFDPNSNFGKSAAHYIFLESAGYESAKFSRDLLVTALKDLAKSLEGKINFDEGTPSAGKVYVAEKHSPEEIAVREFSGAVRESWKTHSYSSISLRSASRDNSGEKDFLNEYHPKQKKGEGIFAFESGARAGLCIHEVFEKTDFTAKDKEYVIGLCSEALDRYRFDLSAKGVLADMFFNVVDTVLEVESGLRLSHIRNESRLSELEFNFPVDSLDYGRFGELFRGGDRYCDKIYKGLAYDRSVPGGMMKGFIDLVFEFNGKYYIADWKSNHLGNSYEDYSREKIDDEMEKHNYFLQYYIYTTALHRYLKQRLGNGYGFDERFGGVYYFFVRGMSPGRGNGVFTDRPGKGMIEKLDQFFCGGK